jgi:hypothetical protein
MRVMSTRHAALGAGIHVLDHESNQRRGENASDQFGFALADCSTLAHLPVSRCQIWPN